MEDKSLQMILHHLLVKSGGEIQITQEDLSNLRPGELHISRQLLNNIDTVIIKFKEKK